MSESTKIEVSAAEYREPDPVAVDLRECRTARSTQSYYRCGYLVAGAQPMMIEKHEKTEVVAKRKAREKAALVRDQLRDLGAPPDVSWWVQRWFVESDEVYKQAQVEAL